MSKRAEGQTFIGCWCDADFVKKIDENREGTRSQFARDALREKLAAMGIEVDEQTTQAPDRAGKGGPKPLYGQEMKSTPYILNETASDFNSEKAADAARNILRKGKAALEDLRQAGAKSRLKKTQPASHVPGGKAQK